MDTFNLYMDDVDSEQNGDGPGTGEVRFRIVPGNMDDGKPGSDAVLAGLDIYDLLDLRNALQDLIDVVVVSALDPLALDELEE